MFVDGENLVSRASAFFGQRGQEIVESKRYRRSCFVWPYDSAYKPPGFHPGLWEPNCFRAHYYASVSGDEGTVVQVREQLRNLGFEPHVFKKVRGSKGKGVDIALTKDMISHAFRGNYEGVALVSGDGDYLPLIEEVKRLGKIVHLYAFESGLSPELRLAADGYSDVAEKFSKDLAEFVRPKPITTSDEAECKRCGLPERHPAPIDCINALKQLNALYRNLPENDLDSNVNLSTDLQGH